MKIVAPLALSCLAGLWACGSSSSGGGGGLLQNAFTGTVTISSALPAGATCTPATTHVVTFRAAGAGTDVHTVMAAGGDCVKFTNSDTAMHRPGPNPPTGCAQMTAPAALSAGQSYTTVPLGEAGG